MTTLLPVKQAKITRPRWLPLAAVAAFACLAAAFAGVTRSTAASADPSTLRVAVAGLPDYLDPQLSYTSEGWMAMYNSYVPLLTFRHASGKAGSKVIPGLARGLPRVTNGGRTYTLFLRHGLRYSNGKPVRASDFEYAIERLFKVHSGGSPFYADIVGARGFQRKQRKEISGTSADDGSGRIVIHLSRPIGTFSEALAMPFAAPVPASTPMRAQTFSPPPATGPYAIMDVSFDGWSYVRNPAWVSGNGRLLPQLPDGHFGSIEVDVVRSAKTRLRDVLSGTLDWDLGSPPAGRLPELQRRFGGRQFRAEPMLATYYFWMNTTKPPFDDVRVRRAANYAANPAVIAKIYDGQVVPSQQILPPDMPGYRRIELYRHSMAKARGLIAAADPPDREVTVWSIAETHDREAAAYYRSQLQKIGLRAHLKVLSQYDYFSAIGNRSTPNLDTGWSNWFADYPHPDDFFRPTLLGSSIQRTNNNNFAQIDIPAFDAKIESLSRRQLGPARERGYAALDRDYMKRAPWVPIGNTTSSLIVAKAIDLDKVVWNPQIGADLASFQLRPR